jgi:hypothetical protein
LAILARNIGLLELAGNAFIVYLQRRPTDVAAMWDYWNYLKALHNEEAIKQFQAFLHMHQINDDALSQDIGRVLASKSKNN